MTGQGICWRKNHAALDCCGDIETQFIDYRFLKDLELHREPKCCCCCVGSEFLIYADDKDSVRYVRVFISSALTNLEGQWISLGNNSSYFREERNESPPFVPSPPA